MAASAAIPAQHVAPRLSWVDAFLQDLQPTPGRLSGTLRIVLASVIALLLLETLQMPFISIGMYFIFLIGRDSPAVSLRSAPLLSGRRHLRDRAGARHRDPQR